MVTREQAVEVDGDDLGRIDCSQCREVVRQVDHGLLAPPGRVVPSGLGTGRKVRVQLAASRLVQRRRRAKRRLIVFYEALYVSSRSSRPRGR